MRKIELTQGLVAVVDDEDFEFLNQWKWCAHRHYKTSYAVRHSPPDKNGKRRLIRMHQEIASRMEMDLSGEKTPDHKDRNGLNNTRENLRPATQAEQNANKDLQKNNTSGFRGVTWRKDCQKWQAQIQIDGRNKSLGRFLTREAAALAYDLTSARIYGKFAYLNLPSDLAQSIVNQERSRIRAALAR